MGIFTYEYEVITEIPPAKMFKACILDGENLIPKVVPDQAFKSIDYIEGNGEPGSIKKITFEEGGSISKISCKYYTIGDFGITEEGLKAGKEKALQILKAVDAYVLANPRH
ncbi:hypothetical protein Goari_023403 [Gossypium aridum]|uniref:Bet v I/Major latex protein domain-containing protein n=1 Tax=Gossypium aridum TaxID=34290 RepID=A0A7J8X464_GOSAI|nr:hypothetical protein [Gossypium aridum]